MQTSKPKRIVPTAYPFCLWHVLDPRLDTCEHLGGYALLDSARVVPLTHEDHRIHCADTDRRVFRVKAHPKRLGGWFSPWRGFAHLDLLLHLNPRERAGLRGWFLIRDAQYIREVEPDEERFGFSGTMEQLPGMPLAVVPIEGVTRAEARR